MRALAAPQQRTRQRIRGAAHFVEADRMRQQAVRELVLSAIRSWIRVNRALEQAQPERVLINAEAILAVSQEPHSIVGIRKVGPPLGRYLEGGFLPTGIAVRRAVDGSELDLVRGASAADRSWKGDFEQRLTLIPVHVSDE